MGWENYVLCVGWDIHLSMHYNEVGSYIIDASGVKNTDFSSWK